MRRRTVFWTVIKQPSRQASNMSAAWEDRTVRDASPSKLANPECRGEREGEGNFAEG
jgi:hypothetical protein